MNMIRLNTHGKILRGEYLGWYVQVQDDREGSTGGFYILIVESLDPKNTIGYDDWVEHFPSVEQLFHERNWEIEWLEKH